MNRIFIFIIMIFLSRVTFADTCTDEIRSTRSKELQEIVSADQAERKNGFPLPEGIQERDQKRRMRVGEIFGEGCMSTSADFSAAALVYQHGNSADHFFQTYIWAKRAVDLGDISQKRLMALGIDRYLINIGKKQLFGSQAYKLVNEKCWCLQPVETTFSEKLRSEYLGRTLEESLSWVDSLNLSNQCPKAQYCSTKLDDSPIGSVPGLW